MPGQPGGPCAPPGGTASNLWFVDVTPQHLDGNQTIARLLTGEVDDRSTALTRMRQDRVAGQHGPSAVLAPHCPQNADPAARAWQRGQVVRGGSTLLRPPVPAPAESTVSSTPARSTPIDQSRVDVDIADTKTTTERRRRAEATRTSQRGRCRRPLDAGTCGVASGSPVFDRGALGTATRCRWPHLQPTLETMLDPSAQRRLAPVDA